MNQVTQSARAKPKGVAVGQVMSSARMVADFADVIIANPREFSNGSRRGAGATANPTGRKVVSIFKELHRKLREVEAALADPGAPARPAPAPAGAQRVIKPGATSRASVQKAETLQELRQQARDALSALVKDGTLIPAKDFLAERRFTKQAMSKALGANRVFSLDVDGETYLPAFYIDPNHDVRKLEKVSKVLGDLPGASKLHFFMSGWGSLGGKTPLEALAHGQLEAVMNTAHGFTEG
ncbi:MAG: hypothetical protein EOP84_09670 [Verrucomicrobiaceae bacterium]|nr:MAG: hypothetical protein EOP84_09670 [Verrucomicrobiaceae bacterium]